MPYRTLARFLKVYPGRRRAPAMTCTAATAAPRAHTVVVVNGTQDMLEALDTVLEPGHYDVVIADSTNDAYSLIKRVKPHLVLVGLRVDDSDGYQVLSMLKLDPETRHIRVVTCTGADDPEETPGGLAETLEEAFSNKPALRMN
jgi:response regulator RpfG family c-di-GMP phosphodiesterase